MEEAHVDMYEAQQSMPMFMIVLKESTITGPKWFVILPTLPKHVMHTNYTLTTFTNLRSTPPNRSIVTFQGMWASCSGTVYSEVFC